MALSNSEKQRRYIARLKARAAEGSSPDRKPDIDPTTCDPMRVLQSIAVDPAAPAGPRVAAAKALLILSRPLQPDPAPAAGEATDLDRRVQERAIALLTGGRTIQ